MRVVLDVSAIPPQRGGAGTYVRELLAHLPATGIEPIAIAQKRDTRTWSGSARVLRLAPSSRAQRLAWEQTSLVSATGSELAKSADAELPRVLHSPHYTVPSFMPGSSGHQQWRPARVVTIHDLTFFTRPQDHEPTKRYFFQAAIRRAARSADALIAVSDATADALQSLMSARAPITVIPHGVDTARFHPRKTTDDRELRVRIGIPQNRPYIAHLGTIEPRKNIRALIVAYGTLLSSNVLPATVEPPTLVLAGTSWPGMEEELGPRIREVLAGSPNANIIRCVNVDDPTAAAILRGASAVLYPSFEEGFGLPVLEALACGTPVITSERSVMADIAGEAVRTINPRNVATIADAIRDVLVDREGVAQRRTAGLLLAERYTWAKSASAHATLYRSFQ